MRPLVLIGFLCFLALSLPFRAQASDLPEREGWIIHQSDKVFSSLLEDLRSAVKAEGLIVVTQAGPTRAAAARGISIPNNLVVGIFNNDFAVRVLETSTAAMIEAPIRFYLTEGPDGTATLSYKTPSHVFAPYLNEGGDTLRKLARELDVLFAAIAAAALTSP